MVKLFAYRRDFTVSQIIAAHMIRSVVFQFRILIPVRWLWIPNRSLDDLLLSLRKYCLGHSFHFVSNILPLDLKFVTT